MSNSDSKKRKMLIERALKFLVTNPGASLSEISAAIGVGRATLQRYFPKREDLLHSIAFDAIETTEKAFKELSGMKLSPQEFLKKCIEILVPIGAHYYLMDTFPQIRKFNEVDREKQRQEKETKQFVRWLQDKGVVDKRLPIAWVSETLGALIWTAWHSVESGSIARNDAVELVYHTFLNGVSNPPEDN